MTYETNKRNYPVPDDDQSPWDDDYQQAMAMLDTDISNLFSNRVLTDSFDNHVSAYDTHISTSDAHHAKTTSDDLEDGGSDELNVGGLNGQLADAQSPTTHDNGSHSTNYSPQSHDHGGGTLGSASNPVSETHSEVGQLGELSVSDGDTVTSGPVGSSGDLVQMAAYQFDGKGYTASSTTFTKVATAVTEHRVIDYESIQNLPNIADVHYAWAGRVNANSGVDVTIRVSGSANTEATFTGSTFSPEVGPTAPVSAADSPRIPKLEVKTSDGSQGGVYAPSIIMYAEKK